MEVFRGSDEIDIIRTSGEVGCKRLSSRVVGRGAEGGVSTEGDTERRFVVAEIDGSVQVGGVDSDRVGESWLVSK